MLISRKFFRQISGKTNFGLVSRNFDQNMVKNIGKMSKHCEKQYTYVLILFIYLVSTLLPFLINEGKSQIQEMNITRLFHI